MKKKLVFFFMFSFFIAEAYHKRHDRKQTTKIVQGRKKRLVNNNYTLHVKGVECKLCAESVIKRLKAIEGVEQVTVTMVGLDFINSYFEFAWTKKNENVPLIRIKQLIEKEGFDFDTIEGLFSGSFSKNIEGKVSFLLDEKTSIAALSAPPKFTEKKELLLKSKIVYDDEKRELNYSIV